MQKHAKDNKVHINRERFKAMRMQEKSRVLPFGVKPYFLYCLAYFIIFPYSVMVKTAIKEGLPVTPLSGFLKQAQK